MSVLTSLHTTQQAYSYFTLLFLFDFSADFPSEINEAEAHPGTTEIQACRQPAILLLPDTLWWVVNPHATRNQASAIFTHLCEINQAEKKRYCMPSSH